MNKIHKEDKRTFTVLMILTCIGMLILAELLLIGISYLTGDFTFFFSGSSGIIVISLCATVFFIVKGVKHLMRSYQ